MTPRTFDDVATRKVVVASEMAQIIEDHGAEYGEVIRGLHDALVIRARLEAEHDPHYSIRHPKSATDRAARDAAHNRVGRMRFLAHQLTRVLTDLAEFDEKYPR